MLWYITYNRIECGSFFFMTSSLNLLGLQLIELQFAQVKNASTKSLDVSLPPFHIGATMVESSAYLKRAGVEPSLISRSFRNTLNKQGPLTLPCVVPLFTPFRS